MKFLVCILIILTWPSSPDFLLHCEPSPYLSFAAEYVMCKLYILYLSIHKCYRHIYTHHIHRHTNIHTRYTLQTHTPWTYPLHTGLSGHTNYYNLLYFAWARSKVIISIFYGAVLYLPNFRKIQHTWANIALLAKTRFCRYLAYPAIKQ